MTIDDMAKTNGSQDTSHFDDETAQVLQILRGAFRAKQDPDLDLAVILARLRGASDDRIQSALSALVSDADPD